MKSASLFAFALVFLAGSAQACTSGHQRCISNNQFQTCVWGAWQPPQPIGPRCVQNGNTVYPGHAA
ncbi:hypothetical protein BKA69DRAFT_1128277 [Paraphysoderma sedebokerense]|nr:hypothetical protein BKA69DRAFT_1128277 [Paraphysoderma sedebokerense]